MPEDESITLTKGSRYRVVSLETREKALVSQGVFRGYATIGPDEALCLELDETHSQTPGRVRLIPSHMVLSVDIVEQLKEPEKEKKQPERMFG